MGYIKRKEGPVEMTDFDKLRGELQNSPNAGRLNAIANSADSQKLSKLVDLKAVENAAKSGDARALSGILAQVMSTEEGKRLAKDLSSLMGK